MPSLPSVSPILVLSFFIECLSLLWTPARDASLPNLVPRRQLANANSLGLVATYGTPPLGAAIFAFLAGTSGLIPYFNLRPTYLALWLDAATFGFSALMISGISIPAPPARPGGRFVMSRVW